MRDHWAWRTNPIPLNVWKSNCYRSSHIRPGEDLGFTEHDDGKVVCYIDAPGVSVFLGTYFKNACTRVGTSIMAGTGWNHE